VGVSDIRYPPATVSTVNIILPPKGFHSLKKPFTTCHVHPWRKRVKMKRPNSNTEQSTTTDTDRLDSLPEEETSCRRQTNLRQRSCPVQDNKTTMHEREHHACLTDSQTNLHERSLYDVQRPRVQSQVQSGLFCVRDYILVYALGEKTITCKINA